jgi:uncharacterized protein YqeY
MSIKAKIAGDTIAAMKLKDAGKEQLKTLRLLQAAIRQKEIDERITLDDMNIYAVISKMIKQRKDAIQQFAKGNRQDLVDNEQKEIDVLQSYLPQPFSEAALSQLISDAIKKANATSIKDMGKVMGLLKNSIQGRADMSTVSAKVKEQLSDTK